MLNSIDWSGFVNTLLLLTEERVVIIFTLQSMVRNKYIQFIWTGIKYSIIDPKPTELLDDAGFNGIFAKIIGFVIGLWMAGLIIANQILSISDHKLNNIQVSIIAIVWLLTRMGNVHSEFKTKKAHDQIIEEFRQERQRADQERQRADQRHKELIDKLDVRNAMIGGDQSEAAINYRNNVFNQCKSNIINEVADSIKSVLDTHMESTISKFDIMENYDLIEQDKKLDMAGIED